MPKIFCCLCSRRTDTDKQRVRLGTNSNWEMLEIHAKNNGLSMEAFTKQDYVCKKCHATISHNRMKDRGPNKIKNVQPTVYEPGITKSVLRSRVESSTSSVTESRTVEQSETVVATTQQITTVDLTGKFLSILNAKIFIERTKKQIVKSIVVLISKTILPRRLKALIIDLVFQRRTHRRFGTTRM